jgi:hypothetical protein
LNNQILPTNLLETKRQWVNQIYFDYIVQQKTIPQNTIDELEILAASSPFVMGDAVYSARNIVGYTEITVNLKEMENTNNTDSVEISPILIKVYPNPANEFITVEINGNTEKSIKFVLTNTIGLKVFEKMLKGSNTTYTIDVRKLKQGIYIYETLFEITGESINKGRIVIIK